MLPFPNEWVFNATNNWWSINAARIEYLFNELRMLIELIVSSGSRINIIYEHTHIALSLSQLPLDRATGVVNSPCVHNATSVHYLVIIFNQSEISHNLCASYHGSDQNGADQKTSSGWESGPFILPVVCILASRKLIWNLQIKDIFLKQLLN